MEIRDDVYTHFLAFVRRARIMRDLQRSYFRSHDYSILTRARAAETSFDNSLTDVDFALRHGRLRPVQTDLFGNADGGTL